MGTSRSRAPRRPNQALLEALLRAATTGSWPAFADERFETARAVFVDAVETAFEDLLEAVAVRDFLTTVFARASDAEVFFRAETADFLPVLADERFETV